MSYYRIHSDERGIATDQFHREPTGFAGLGALARPLRSPEFGVPPGQVRMVGRRRITRPAKIVRPLHVRPIATRKNLYGNPPRILVAADPVPSSVRGVPGTRAAPPPERYDEPAQTPEEVFGPEPGFEDRSETLEDLMADVEAAVAEPAAVAAPAVAAVVKAAGKLPWKPVAVVGGGLLLLYLLGRR